MTPNVVDDVYFPFISLASVHFDADNFYIIHVRNPIEI